MNDIDFFDDDEIDTPIHQPFKIETLDQAEWAMRKIERARKEIARFDEAAQKVIDKIKARVEILAKSHKHTIESMTVLLEPWVSLEIAKQGKKRSYNMIGGTAGYRSSPNSIEITDEAAAIQWLEEHKAIGCVVIKKVVVKKAVHDLIKAKGEIPDGIEVKPGETKFYVNTNVDLIEELK
jgi:phage host-nuclease inhibitor protein Gam